MKYSAIWKSSFIELILFEARIADAPTITANRMPKSDGQRGLIRPITAQMQNTANSPHAIGSTIERYTFSVTSIAYWVGDITNMAKIPSGRSFFTDVSMAFKQSPEFVRYCLVTSSMPTGT